MTMNAVPSILSKIVPDVDTEENDGQMKLLGQQACKHLRERPGHPWLTVVGVEGETGGGSHLWGPYEAASSSCHR